MADIKELERYFDILLEDSSQYGSEHPMSDDEKRFELYESIKSRLVNIADGLGVVSGKVDNSYYDYIPLLKQLGGCFKQLSDMKNDELDYCMRTVAVEGVIKAPNKELATGDEALGVLIEDISGLFFDDSDEVMKTTKDAMEALKNRKGSKFFRKKQDEELKRHAMHVLSMFNELEGELREAKSGVIAKDKKMIEVLRQLRLGVGRQLINMAVERSSVKPKALKDLVKKGTGSHASDIEKGRGS